LPGKEKRRAPAGISHRKQQRYAADSDDDHEKQEVEPSSTEAAEALLWGKAGKEFCVAMCGCAVIVDCHVDRPKKELRSVDLNIKPPTKADSRNSLRVKNVPFQVGSSLH
jgi:hypothetical protein